ncbi:MAG: flagellar hook-basal body complex protein [Planctomycetes bacterium]|nr:flagellar hook-basal body complex protein [Planctomycetota bacterium]
MVNTSLFSGLSGLRAHSRYIDVIGNNLANVSTPGFWSSRATFSDILSFTISPGSGPNGNFGGNNPTQIGLGVGVASIDLTTTQGTFQDTSRPLDVALQGKGFFTLTDGSQTFYTRAGAFGIDANRNLVDVRTGLRVVSSSGSSIDVPVTDTLPPKATSRVAFEGNLPAEVKGPLAEVFQSESALKSGTAASLTGSPSTGTTYNMTSYVGTSSLNVFVNGKGAQSIVFQSGDFVNAAAATASEIATAINKKISDLEVTGNDTNGSFTIDTVRLGTGATLQITEGKVPSLISLFNLSESLVRGTETALDTSSLGTDLNDLTGRVKRYQSGDGILVRGNLPDNSQVETVFRYGAANDGTTVQDLLDFINTAFKSGQTDGATASIDDKGNLKLQANSVGPAEMSLYIGDPVGGNPGKGSALFPSIVLTQDGTGPDTHVTTIDVFDSLGVRHPVTLTFTRDEADKAKWRLEATMDPSEGVINNGLVDNIRFNNNGSLTTGNATALNFTFANTGGVAQDVAVDLGTASQFDGLVMTGNKGSAQAVDQDGYAAGELLNWAFSQKGELQGQYSNGQTQMLNVLRIALFPNEGGLLRQGSTLFVEAPNSDNPVNTVAGVSGAGFVRPGSLENSNVDIASEFVKLIEAQRGFQANSRVITTTDEILAELINIVR